MIVVDTNVLVRLVFDTNSISADVRLRDREWAIPRLWRSEFRSALAGMIRVQGLPPEQASDAFRRAEALVSVESEPDTAEIIALVQRTNCTAYDLEFVAVALSLGVPLVTNDKQVLAEFPAIAISLEAFAA